MKDIDFIDFIRSSLGFYSEKRIYKSMYPCLYGAYLLSSSKIVSSSKSVFVFCEIDNHLTSKIIHGIIELIFTATHGYLLKQKPDNENFMSGLIVWKDSIKEATIIVKELDVLSRDTRKKILKKHRENLSRLVEKIKEWTHCNLAFFDHVLKEEEKLISILLLLMGLDPDFFKYDTEDWIYENTKTLTSFLIMLVPVLLGAGDEDIITDLLKQWNVYDLYKNTKDKLPRTPKELLEKLSYSNPMIELLLWRLIQERLIDQDLRLKGMADTVLFRILDLVNLCRNNPNWVLDLLESQCPNCQKKIDRSEGKKGRHRIFCSDKCRVEYFRKRKRGDI